jgi:PAS domain S-box-containing protein
MNLRMRPCVRILVVDDHEPARSGIRSLLSAMPELDFCGEAVDGIDAVEKTRDLRPNVVLMDISMPGMDGLEATRIIRRECPETKVILVSQNDLSIVKGQAEEVGASGCVDKATLSRDLLPAIGEIFDDSRVEDPQTSVAHTGKSPTWFEGGGQMSELMRSTDWSKTPLGAPESWSPALRMMVNFMLANRFPQLLWWGPQFCSIYNDAYVPILGEKHSWAIGRPVSEVWHEIWHVLKPLVETPFQGGPATWLEDIELIINRRGFLEETHFTVAYSPVPDETVPSGIGGVLATVHEITEKVVGERRIATLRDLGAAAAESKFSEAACANAARILARHSKDVPFALIYLLDSKERSARLAGSTGVDISEVGRLEILDDLDSKIEKAWPVAEMIGTEEIYLVEDIRSKFQKLPNSAWPDPTNAAALVPIRSNMAHQLAGFMIVGISPRLQFDEGYRNFLELMSTQIATTIANARAYEEEKKRAEALAEIDRAKTAFFSNVSHEFRTPLTLMLGPLDDLLARSHTDLTPATKTQLEMVNRNGVRLLRLVNNLLDFSRIEAGRAQIVYQPTDLTIFTAELASVFRSAIERAGLKLKIDCHALSKPVYVDRDMWEKIVLNLISNALKFTFDGEITVSVEEKDDAAELRVHDTGVGIPQAEMPRLFERFHRIENARTRTHEGSGIGLALVHELVKLHNGTLRAESTPGRGSTFIVTIPLGANHIPVERTGKGRTLPSSALSTSAFVEEALRWLPDADAVSEEELPSANELLALSCPPTSDVTAGRPRLLVADDNSDMRRYLVRLMAEHYEVEAVPDGVSALAAARERRPDLVLSDVMMPRLDGLGLLRELRADPKLCDVPIILLSARAGEESRIQGFEAGADDYLVKPFTARDLAARVRSQLEIARIRGQAIELEHKLRLEAETLAAIVASSDDAIISKNLDGTITSWNKGAERIFGYSEEEAIGQHITLIIPQQYRDEEKSILERLRRGERVDHFETVRLRKDGTTTDISVTISPVKDVAGRVIGASKVGRDISERKQTEAKLKELHDHLEVRVSERTAELQEKNRELLKQTEVVRDLSGRLLQSQDEERRRIARELHDSAGQLLAAINMNISKVAREKEKLSTRAGRSVEEAADLVQQALVEIRTMSHLLHPPLLDEVGLESALRGFIEGFAQRSKIDVNLVVTAGFERLSPDQEITIFRVVQECLTNVHRHSGSSKAEVRLARRHGCIYLEVSDEGKGIPLDKRFDLNSPATLGVGFRGMRERIRQLGGTLQVHSNGNGTNVEATLPIEQARTQQGKL